jgi:hypothetical protein
MKALHVVAKTPSFWRCGRQFGPTPTVIPISELTDEELERLKAETMLVAVEVEVEDPPKKKLKPNEGDGKDPK